MRILKVFVLSLFALVCLSQAEIKAQDLREARDFIAALKKFNEEVSRPLNALNWRLHLLPIELESAKDDRGWSQEALPLICSMAEAAGLDPSKTLKAREFGELLVFMQEERDRLLAEARFLVEEYRSESTDDATAEKLDKHLEQLLMACEDVRSLLTIFRLRVMRGILMDAALTLGTDPQGLSLVHLIEIEGKRYQPMGALRFVTAQVNELLTEQARTDLTKEQKEELKQRFKRVRKNVLIARSFFRRFSEEWVASLTKNANEILEEDRAELEKLRKQIAQLSWKQEMPKLAERYGSQAPATKEKLKRQRKF